MILYFWNVLIITVRITYKKPYIKFKNYSIEKKYEHKSEKIESRHFSMSIK
jgi:hypothetical protein